MSTWTDVHELLTELSDEEMAELDRYVGDQPIDYLERSERARYSSGDWLREQQAPAFGPKP